MANSSEDLSDKLSDAKKKIKSSKPKKNKKVETSVASTGGGGGGGGGGSSSAASSAEDDQEDLYENNANTNANNMLNRGSLSNTNNNNVNNNNNNLYGVYRKYRKRPVWEVIEGYRDPNMRVQKPANYEGILLKRRNWPMKGWHKRYFILADGILTYGKSKADAKTQPDFAAWLDHLKLHRLYYQYKYTQQSTSYLSPNQPSDPKNNQNNNGNLAINSNSSNNNTNVNDNQATTGNVQLSHSRNQSATNLTNDQTKSNKLAILDDDLMNERFKQVEDSLINLSKALDVMHLTNAPTASNSRTSNHQVTPSSASLDQAASCMNPAALAGSSVASVAATSSNNKIHLSKSNPNLINNEIQPMNSNQPGLLVPSSALATANLSSPTASLINSSNAIAGLVMASTGSSIVLNVPDYPNCRTNFNNAAAAAAAVSSFSVSNTLVPGGSAQLTNANAENSIRFIQEAKSINEQLNGLYQQLLFRKQQNTINNKAQNEAIESTIQRSQRSQSMMSSISLQDSQLQFYDAIEYFTSDSDSEENDDNENDSDANEGTSNQKQPTPAIVPEELQALKMLTRRRKLPAVSPDTSQVSLWSILRKAIGKDLSKIALPVILNEPLGILQRLCEELEYSDLLDMASSTQDPYERMVYIAAFVISGYSSSYYRNGAKDFNPLLGETYELIRPDKGWKYVSEQVSHHPPISACHCHSKNFIHEQIFHAKIKFWGRSMEVHPEGFSRVTLPKFNEVYQWNKIVMYVYNLTGAQRKIEHVGEITIKCTNGVSCSITFPKSGYSTQKNEFYGDIIFDNVVKRKIFGQWHESFLCGTDNTAKTIWRMGAMPEDCHLYYGFTRFAIELNEITEDIKDDLPPTDTRFRPDQRLLEIGKTDQAESEKQRIEEIQRARRREMETRGQEHQPIWFDADKDNPKEWTFNNQYWTKRENPSYKNLKNFFPVLW